MIFFSILGKQNHQLVVKISILSSSFNFIDLLLLAGKFGALFASIPFTIFVAVYYVLFGLDREYLFYQQFFVLNILEPLLYYFSLHMIDTMLWLSASVGLSFLQVTNMNSLRTFLSQELLILSLQFILTSISCHLYILSIAYFHGEEGCKHRSCNIELRDFELQKQCGLLFIYLVAKQLRFQLCIFLW